MNVGSEQFKPNANFWGVCGLRGIIKYSWYQ